MASICIPNFFLQIYIADNFFSKKLQDLVKNYLNTEQSPKCRKWLSCNALPRRI